jgi:hypothetical protein
MTSTTHAGRLSRSARVAQATACGTLGAMLGGSDSRTWVYRARRPEYEGCQRSGAESAGRIRPARTDHLSSPTPPGWFRGRLVDRPDGRPWTIATPNDVRHPAVSPRRAARSGPCLVRKPARTHERPATRYQTAVPSGPRIRCSEGVSSDARSPPTRLGRRYVTPSAISPSVIYELPCELGFYRVAGVGFEPT